MDKIKALREKFNMPSGEELEHSFHAACECAEETRRKEEEKLLELNTKAQELKSQCEILDVSLRNEKQALEEKLQELEACNEKSKELETDKFALLNEIQQLEKQQKILTATKPNLKDQQTLEQGCKKFQYYKQLTGIRWDYGAPKDIVKGYVTNGKDYIHTFTYRKEEHGSNLPDLLWEEIEKGTRKASISSQLLAIAETDENKSPNNQ